MKKEYKDILLTILKEGIIYLIFLSLFILLSVFLFNNYGNIIDSFDNAIINFKNTNLRSNTLTLIMEAITYVGSYGSYILILLVAFVMFRKKLYIPFFMTCAVGGSGVINKIIKHFIHRPRPVSALIPIPDSFSFPSGHTMCSFVFYMYLIYLVKKYVKDKSLNNTLTIILSLFPILIGISRVYLGVHFASDVIAGAIVGIVTFIPFIRITNSIKEGFKW